VKIRRCHKYSSSIVSLVLRVRYRNLLLLPPQQGAIHESRKDFNSEEREKKLKQNRSTEENISLYLLWPLSASRFCGFFLKGAQIGE